MPFTPYHFGPGLLLKGALGRRFSMSAFVVAQVVIDCETLYNIVRGAYPLHTTLHTFPGAALAGLVAAGATIVGARLVAWIGWDVRQSTNHTLRAEGATIGALTGGLLGGLTHPLLDGVMHRDIRPFLPVTDANPLLGLVGLDVLHEGCIAAGVLGIVATAIWLFRDRRPGAGRAS